MSTPLSVVERISRKALRAHKLARQWLRAAAHRRLPNTRPVFVLGSQRSGTRLPLVVMERSRDIITYNEGAAPYFDGVLLRSDPVIKRLLRHNPFPIVVLKPICESHRAIEFLDGFPRARVVWIYRHYADAVNSASVKWTSGRRAVGYLATGKLQAAGWRAGGLSTDRLESIAQLYREDMTVEAANALMWYARNSLFFDLGLERRDDVLLVKYEDLALEPARYFPLLFDFVQCRFDAHTLKRVYGSSVARRPVPQLPTPLRAACEEVHERLTSFYVKRSGAAA